MEFGYWLTTCVIMVPGILWASWIDYRERRVPNWLNAAIAAAGFAAQGWYYGLSGMGWGVVGLLIGFGVLIVPWLMHGMGAGDVKLMMAIGVWLGPALTLWSFLVGVLIGGLIAGISALFFIYIQAAVLKKYCTYCLIVDTSAIIILVLSCVIVYHHGFWRKHHARK